MLNALLTALNGLTDIPFVELAWSHSPDDKYGVITLDNQIALNTGASPVSEKMLSGFVDVFIKKPQDLSVIDDVESVLHELGIWFALNSVQFEDDTGYVHYEWEWRDSIGVVTKDAFIVRFVADGEEIAPPELVFNTSDIEYPDVDNIVKDGLTYSFAEWNEATQGSVVTCTAVFCVVVSISVIGARYYAMNGGNAFTDEQVQSVIEWSDNGGLVLCGSDGTYATDVGERGILFKPNQSSQPVIASWVVA